MKIAIVGSHGTGKTTIVERVKEKTGIPKIKEVAREVMGTMGKRPQDMNQEELERFQKKIYYGQKQEEEKHTDFIADRGIYDNLAYVSFVSESLADALIQITKEKHKGYDKVYYTPIEFPLEKDGTRFEDTKFQKQVDDKIKEILNLLQIEYETLSGSIEEREDRVLSYINSKWKT